jgi:hypothetical protein
MKSIVTDVHAFATTGRGCCDEGAGFSTERLSAPMKLFVAPESSSRRLPTCVRKLARHELLSCNVLLLFHPRGQQYGDHCFAGDL